MENEVTNIEWPYRGKKVIVLSSGFPELPVQLKESVKGSSLSPNELLKHLASTGSSHVYVDGGKTIQNFLRDNLIHEMTITRIPILIGEGISLFGPLMDDIKLQHLSTKPYESGIVQSKYLVTSAT